MIPGLGIDPWFHRHRLVFAPAKIRAPQDDRIIEIAQAGEVSVVRIDSFLLVSGAENKTGIAILPKQLDVRFDRVVLPIGEPFISLAPRSSELLRMAPSDRFPCTAEGGPVVPSIKRCGVGRGNVACREEESRQARKTDHTRRPTKQAATKKTMVVRDAGCLLHWPSHQCAVNTSRISGESMFSRVRSLGCTITFSGNLGSMQFPVDLV